jgi:regulator of protease activity HflC (stomatin/prohibitin superfamily)
VQNLPWGLGSLTLSALRNVIGQLDLDHTLSSRDSPTRSCAPRSTPPHSNGAW